MCLQSHGLVVKSLIAQLLQTRIGRCSPQMCSTISPSHYMTYLHVSSLAVFPRMYSGYLNYWLTGGTCHFCVNCMLCVAVRDRSHTYPKVHCSCLRERLDARLSLVPHIFHINTLIHQMYIALFSTDNTICMLLSVSQYPTFMPVLHMGSWGPNCFL